MHLLLYYSNSHKKHYKNMNGGLNCDHFQMIQLATNRCSQWYVVMGSQVVVNGYHKLGWC